MGTISILLGLLCFFGMTAAGIVFSNYVIEQKMLLTSMVESLAAVSNTGLTIEIIAVFAIIGLLLGMVLIMLGLNHRKLAAIERKLKRRH